MRRGTTIVRGSLRHLLLVHRAGGRRRANSNVGKSKRREKMQKQYQHYQRRPECLNTVAAIHAVSLHVFRGSNHRLMEKAERTQFPNPTIS